MAFYLTLTNFQVETPINKLLFNNKKDAELEYQKFVKENVPCELFEDGHLQMKHNPN